VKVKSKVWFEKGGELCFGTGKARMLRAVERAGSLNKAAQRLGMSYRHVWSSVRAAEERLGKPLLIRRKGGRTRGGAVLTDYAKELMRDFATIETDTEAVANRRFGELFGRKRSAGHRARAKKGE